MLHRRGGLERLQGIDDQMYITGQPGNENGNAGWNVCRMAEKVSVQKSGRLEELVKQRFTPEGKAERVAKALAALYQEEPIGLSPEEWKWVAEEADLEDQS